MMTLEEILQSDMLISFELLKENGITLEYIKQNYNVVDNINPKRMIEILKVYESIYKSKKLKPDNNLVFMLFFEFVKTCDFESAYQYVKYLYANEPHYECDYGTYLILLQELVENPERIYIDNIFVDRFDMRFGNTKHQNSIREAIKKRDFDKADKIFKGLYARPLNTSEIIISILLKSIIRKRKETAINCIEEDDYVGFKQYLDSKTNKEGVSLVQDYLYYLWCDVIEGYDLLEPSELPKMYNIYDAVKANDLETVGKIANEEVTSLLAKKIIDTNQANIEGDYSGKLRRNLDNLLEDLYSFICNRDFKSIEDLIVNYLESINRDFWIFYILNIFDELKGEIDTLDEENLTLRIADIFDLLVEISRKLTKDGENILIKKYMASTKNTSQFYETGDIDYNYGIEGISEIISSINDKTIDYEKYANKDYYSEDDLFTLAIIARENYRLSNKEIGNTIIKILKSLIKENEIDSKELKLFIEAIELNKDTLKGRKAIAFKDEVKKLIRD